MDVETGDRAPESHAMQILEAGLPLTLLLDLVTLDLSLSRDLVQVERADTSWVHSAA